jgi:Asp-tRNA(Asn)/Glu-tRNA(Gln) amidotransferase C subunit
MKKKKNNYNQDKNLLNKLLKSVKFQLNKEETEQFLKVDLPYFKTMIKKIEKIDIKYLKKTEQPLFLNKKCCHQLRKDDFKNKSEKIKKKNFLINDKLIDKDGYFIIKNIKK